MVRCPLPGFTGDTFEEAKLNLAEAIELYVETWGTDELKSSVAEPQLAKIEVAVPDVSGAELVKALRKAGFVVLGQKGSPCIVEKTDAPRNRARNFA
jgi:predicted RNase H-like HicB family nuclease